MTDQNHPILDLVSVVLTSYNYGHYICETLDGLKDQTYSKIEVIVIDDCSTDDTEQIVATWAEKNQDAFVDLIYMKLPRNCDQEWANNVGFALAQGEYIALHDADDMSHQERIQLQVDHLKANIDVAAVGTRYSTFKDDRNNIISTVNWLVYDREEITRNYTERLRHCVTVGTLLFRACILDDLIGFRKVVRIATDLFFISDIISYGYLADNIRQTLYYYRTHEKQRSIGLKGEQPLADKDRFSERVSVVIPVENSEATILRVLESIANQSYNDLELILVDNRSTDQTEEVVRRWYKTYQESGSGQIKELIYFKPLRNVIYPLYYNIGAYLSKGKYIALINDTGTLHEHKFKKQVDFLTQNFLYSIVGTNFTGDNSDFRYDDEIEYAYIVEYVHCVNLNTILMRSEVIDQLGGLNTRMPGKEDFEFIHRVIHNGYRVQNINEVLYYE